MFSIIAAHDIFDGIGKNGKIPWSMPEDMAHFKHITTHVDDNTKQNAVIMGRKTWESLPRRFRPLPHRKNIVISSSGDRPCSLHEALDICYNDHTIETTFVIGGGVVYKEAIVRDDCQYLYITRINVDYHCDTFFPRIDLSRYHIDSLNTDSNLLTFLKYKRV